MLLATRTLASFRLQNWCSYKTDGNVYRSYLVFRRGKALQPRISNGISSLPLTLHRDEPNWCRARIQYLPYAIPLLPSFKLASFIWHRTWNWLEFIRIIYLAIGCTQTQSNWQCWCSALEIELLLSLHVRLRAISKWNWSFGVIFENQWHIWLICSVTSCLKRVRMALSDKSNWFDCFQFSSLGRLNDDDRTKH